MAPGRRSPRRRRRAAMRWPGRSTGADQYQVWTTDSSGNELSIPFVGSGAQVASYEASFNDDLNGDGTIGVPPPPSLTVIESSGSMSLLTDGTNYFLQPNGGPAVELSYDGAPVTAGEFAQYGAWTPRSPRRRRRADMRWPGRSRAPISIRFGPPTAAAMSSQSHSWGRAPRWHRTRPVSTTT